MLKEQKRKEAQLRHDRLVDDDRKKKEARKAEQVRPSSAPYVAFRAVVSCAAWCAWKKDAESHSAPHRPLALRSEP